MFPSFMFEHSQEDSETELNYPLSKLTSDLVGILATMARETRLVLAIENIEEANPATIRFLEQLSFRAAEVPMRLVLTCRAGRPDLKLSTVLNECVGEEFRRIRLQTLTALESQDLAQYFEGSSERRRDLLQISAGNPLLIEEYAKGIPKSHFRNRTNGCDLEDLAYYFLEAGELEEAGKLYRRLANEAYEKRNYQDARIFYEHLRESERRGVLQFPAPDKINLAHCYASVGRPTQSRAVCEELLSNDAVVKDPELLSRVYARMANIFDKRPAEERVRLSRLALECLTSDSPKLFNRYLHFCRTLMKAGALSDAAETLKKAKEFRPLSPKVANLDRKSTRLNSSH